LQQISGQTCSPKRERQLNHPRYVVLLSW